MTKLLIALYNLHRGKVGALLVIESDTTPFTEAVDERAVAVDALFSVPLVEAIFCSKPPSPLHDGVAVIRISQSDERFRLAKMTIRLRLGQEAGGVSNLLRSMGTRHQAAAEVSRRTECVVIVVSEQTGNIAFAEKGRLVVFADIIE